MTSAPVSFIAGQKRGAVGAEINDGHAGFLQALHHVGDMRQDIAAIVFDAEAADPAVENLDGVGAGAHLLGGILGRSPRPACVISASQAAGELYIIFLAWM